MKHPLVVRPEAESDVEEAYRWYEDHRPGLGCYDGANPLLNVFSLILLMFIKRSK
jgi:hypothetical protein